MRWMFRIAGALVVAVVVVVIGLLLLPHDRIVRIATEQVEARTGRDMTVSGDVSLSFWPVLGVNTGPVTLGNADWAGAEPMLSASGLSIGVSAVELLIGSIRVTGIVAEDPVLRLQTGAGGRANWVFEEAPTETSVAATDGAAPETSQDRAIALDLLEVRNGTLIYREADAAPITFSGVDLELKWPDPSGPAKLAATVRPASVPIDIKAEFASPGTLIGGAVSPVALQVELPSGTLDFDGRANLSGELAGRLDMTSKDIGKSTSALGLSAIVLPAGWGPAVRLLADMTYTADGRLSMREMRSELGENRLNGVVDVMLADVPQITAKLSAGVLTFPASAGAGTTRGTGETAAAPGVADDGWSRKPIDASALGFVNGSVRVAAEGIKTPDLTVGPVQLRVEVDRSRAVLHLEDVSVFDGRVTGRLVANNRNGLSVGGALSAADIDLQQVQRDLLGMERVQGKAAGELEFLGVGNSVDAIMRSLAGKGGLSMGRGVILGLDLDRLMRGDAANGGTTVFDSLAASFVMREGSAFNDNLLLQLSNYRADGEGRIGLGARDIDYTFTPVALRARSGQGISLPIRIKGPWGAPRIWPDLEAAAKANADAKLEEIENEAKTKLQQKLAEELDVQIEQGQDAEEVLKDKLEDEVKDQLFKLLGRN
ncbi:AsmA family protein [Sedimentitalea todarodis]|uniref:AsmA family protein n=1 Tax=Sedimentitalea todarodis TaxID=1631240 RepID=A0ABU3VH91_9RHOB|nr:AsmA family protein [Sedimentitalea todarodis]MDU9005054.1 AsmA family protein [Sedimentitalea todarodis]